jgi:hypothetical protein
MDANASASASRSDGGSDSADVRDAHKLCTNTESAGVGPSVMPNRTLQHIQYSLVAIFQGSLPF